jgi:hypothetical protein
VQSTKLTAINAFQEGLLQLTPNGVGRQSKSYIEILNAVAQLEILAKKDKLTLEENSTLTNSMNTIQNSFGALYYDNRGLRNAILLHDFVTKSEDMFKNLTEGMNQQLDLSEFKKIVLEPILQLRNFKDLFLYKSGANKAATYDFLSTIKSEDTNFNASLNRTKKAFDVKDSLKIFKLMKSDPERFLHVLRSIPTDQVVEPSPKQKESVEKMIELYASDTSKEIIKKMDVELKTDENYKNRHYRVIAAIISFCRFITFNSDARLAQNIKDAFQEVAELTSLFPDLVKDVEVTQHTKALLTQREQASTDKKAKE